MGKKYQGKTEITKKEKTEFENTNNDDAKESMSDFSYQKALKVAKKFWYDSDGFTYCKLITVFKTFNNAEILIAKSLLDYANIKCSLKNEKRIFPLIEPIELQVNSGDFYEAKNILSNFMPKDIDNITNKKIEGNFKLANLAFKKGLEYYNQKKYSNAEKQFKKALQIFQNSTDFMYNLTIVYLAQKKKKLARNLIEKLGTDNTKRIIDEYNSLDMTNKIDYERFLPKYIHYLHNYFVAKLGKFEIAIGSILLVSFFLYIISSGGDIFDIFIEITDLFPLLSPFAVWLIFHGRKLIASTRIVDDQRKPILYLRSFLDDGTGGSLEWDEKSSNFSSNPLVVTLEEMLFDCLSEFGPCVTFAAPDEEISELGFVRLKASQKPWQEIVTEYIKSSQLVIVSATFTTGLLWEAATAIRLVPPERLLFLLPFGFAQESSERIANLKGFKLIMKELLHKKLPKTVRDDAIFLYFDPDGSPHFLYKLEPNRLIIKHITLGTWNKLKDPLSLILKNIGYKVTQCSYISGIRGIISVIITIILWIMGVVILLKLNDVLLNNSRF